MNIQLNNPGQQHTWQVYFDYEDKNKLGTDELAKAEKWKAKLISDYNKELNLLYPDGTNIHQSSINPIQIIMRRSMAEGRLPKPIRYIAIIGFLTYYNGEGQNAVYMNDDCFMTCVTRTHLDKLNEWRKALYNL
jgi:hypothetical protein